MKQTGNDRTLFYLIKELGKSLRMYQQEGVFCEGVTFNQFSILDLVAEKESLRLSDLHKLLSVEKSTTTRLVDPIVKQGLLERTNSEQDSRAIDLKITKAGKEVHQKVWQCISEFMDGVMDQIPEGKKEDVINALRLFIRALNNCCSSCCTDCCE